MISRNFNFHFFKVKEGNRRNNFLHFYVTATLRQSMTFLGFYVCLIFRDLSMLHYFRCKDIINGSRFERPNDFLKKTVEAPFVRQCLCFIAHVSVAV